MRCHVQESSVRRSRLGPAILAGITEIRRQRGDSRRARILQRRDHEQHAIEPLVDAVIGRRMQALNDIDVAATHILQRPHLVLAIFEEALLMFKDRQTQGPGNTLAEVARGVQCEQGDIFSLGWNC